MKFNYVTPDLLRVTCDRCLSMLGAMCGAPSVVEAEEEPSGASLHEPREVRGPQAATEKSPQNRVYFCVIDRFCYESREYGLIHMRLQHGIMNQENFLLREKLAGGPL